MSESVEDMIRRGVFDRFPSARRVAYGMDCTDPDPANWKPFGWEVGAAGNPTVPLPGPESLILEGAS